MYLGETELERQTRLQADADAQRAIDTLREASIGSLPEITVKGNPTVWYILAAAVMTGLLFPLKSNRRSLFLLFLCFVPSLMMAQTVTPFTQKTVSGADTFMVYGKSLTLDSTTYVTTTKTITRTTTTVDSIVKVTTPIVLGKLFGPSSINTLPSPFRKPPFTASGGESSGNNPTQLLKNLDKAKQTGIPIIAALPCGSHNQAPDRRGNCLRDSSGIAVFSRALFDSALAKYNTPAVKAAVDSAFKNGYLIAVNLMDEPWVKGGGDGNTWGPKGLTRQQADTSCLAAKTGAFANVPVGLSDASLKIWPANGYTFKWCDVGIPQFSYRMGTPTAWRDSILTMVAKGQYMEIFSFNVVNGGKQDKTTWPACPGAPASGTSSPNCTMNTTEITTAVAALGDVGCGALIMWRTDSTRFAKIGQAVFNTAAATQAQRPKRPCKVR